MSSTVEADVAPVEWRNLEKSNGFAEYDDAVVQQAVSLEPYSCDPAPDEIGPPVPPWSRRRLTDALAELGPARPGSIEDPVRRANNDDEASAWAETRGLQDATEDAPTADFLNGPVPIHEQPIVLHPPSDIDEPHVGDSPAAPLTSPSTDAVQAPLASTTNEPTAAQSAETTFAPPAEISWPSLADDPREIDVDQPAAVAIPPPPRPLPPPPRPQFVAPMPPLPDPRHTENHLALASLGTLDAPPVEGPQEVATPQLQGETAPQDHWHDALFGAAPDRPSAAPSRETAPVATLESTAAPAVAISSPAALPVWASSVDKPPELTFADLIETDPAFDLETIPTPLDSDQLSGLEIVRALAAAGTITPAPSSAGSAPRPASPELRLSPEQFALRESSAALGGFTNIPLDSELRMLVHEPMERPPMIIERAQAALSAHGMPMTDRINPLPALAAGASLAVLTGIVLHFVLTTA